MTVEVTWETPCLRTSRTNQQEATSSSDQNSQYDGSYNPLKISFRLLLRRRIQRLQRPRGGLTPLLRF
jgi:hypothetical protein